MPRGAGRDALRKALGTLAQLADAHCASVDDSVIASAVQTSEAKLDLMTEVRQLNQGFCLFGCCIRDIV